MTPEDIKYNHLIELTGSDFEIVDGQPDIRGWEVRDKSGRVIGEIKELLINPPSERVRYIIMDVNYETYAADMEKLILVPIGLVELYDGYVVAPISRDQIRQLPAYELNGLSPDVELFNRYIYEEGPEKDLSSERDQFDPDRFYIHKHFMDKGRDPLLNRRRPMG